MNKDQWLIIGAFATTYFVWGSTYLANYWAIDTLPVFGMGGTRFLAAGALLYLISFFKGKQGLPTVRQWANAGLIGLMFLTIGVGAVVWAQQWIPTSTTALIIAFEPLIVMIIMWIFFSNRPPLKAFLGAAISITGMFLLINQPATLAGEGSVKGLIAILSSMLCWAFAMTLSPRLDMGENKFRATAMQMLVGGMVLMAFSLVVNDWAGFRLSQVSTKSAMAWLFLVFFGAILAFSAFNYLLSRVSPDKASTNTYVNPVVAVALGALLNQEVISGQTVVAGAVMLTGVYFIQSAKAKVNQVEAEAGTL